ncbi:MAG: carbohydrate kinase [Actinomycetaceae bacterium]|nr:carbohydrate kinase [Actinomycetaceae bacterium]
MGVKSNSGLRLLCAGGASVDSFSGPDGETTWRVGGSVLNVAVGTARQDIPTTLATSFCATDTAGQLIRAKLDDVGVQIAPGSDGAPHSTIAYVTLDAEAKASYVFERYDDLPDINIRNFSHVHIGSLGAFLEPSGPKALALIQAAHAYDVSVSYDINVRPSKMGEPETARNIIRERINVCDIVKASDDDIAWICPERPVESVLREWLDMGASLAVATLGKNGAMLLGKEWDNPIYAPSLDVTVVDTVGAGDSFMAGMLAILWQKGYIGLADSDGTQRRHRLTELSPDIAHAVLANAIATASLTVTRKGAYAPSSAEIAQMLAN